MPNYLRLIQDPDQLAVFITQCSHEWEPLDLGEAMPADTKPPFMYEMEVDEHETADARDQLRPDFDSAGPIFSEKFLQLLTGAGANNLEVFPAIVTDNETGEEIHDYSAVNIVGLVPLADMAKSDAVPLVGRHYFVDLKTDPEKESELLIFRLAEQPADILIHEKLAALIQSSELVGISLEPTS